MSHVLAPLLPTSQELACPLPTKPFVRVQLRAIRVNGSAALPLHGGCTYLELVLGLPVYLAAVFEAEVCACLLRGGTIFANSGARFWEIHAIIISARITCVNVVCRSHVRCAVRLNELCVSLRAI